MLKKNQPVKFAKPMSTMRQVLSAVERGGDVWLKRVLREKQNQAN